jgi:hypothetical protein
MNRRKKEFIEEVVFLLRGFVDYATIEARNRQISPYDVEIEKEYILTWHKTQRCIATDMCVDRHFENLENREIFVYVPSKEGYIKLNRKLVKEAIDIMGTRVTMPSDDVIL